MSTDLAHFDPIEASKNLKSGFIDYITTTFHITDPVYKAALRTELSRNGFLTKGPYLDMNGSYKAGRSLRELMDLGLVSRRFETLEPVGEKERELKIERPLCFTRKTNSNESVYGTGRAAEAQIVLRIG